MNNIALLMIDKNFKKVHDKFCSFLEHKGRVNNWSCTHNSFFSLDKFPLLNCRTHTKNFRPVLHLSNSTSITFIDHHHFLGLLIDHQLKFKEHLTMILTKGIKLVRLLHQLAYT